GITRTVRRRAAIRCALVRPHPEERACGRGAANPGGRARVSKDEEGSCKPGLRLFPVFVLLAPVMGCNPGRPTRPRSHPFPVVILELTGKPQAPGCTRPPVFLLLLTGKQGHRMGRAASAILDRRRPSRHARGRAISRPKGRDPVTQERIRELTKTMLRQKFYVLLSKGGAAPGTVAEHLPRPLEYMIGLEKKGVLFASGPLAEADGKTRGDGLTIVRAASAQAARKIAEADPFVVHGLRSFELREWTVMEGSLGIKVNFSDQSLELA